MTTSTNQNGNYELIHNNIKKKCSILRLTKTDIKGHGQRESTGTQRKFPNNYHSQGIITSNFVFFNMDAKIK